MCVNFCVSNELYRAFFSWLSINHCQINHNHPSQQRKIITGKKNQKKKQANYQTLWKHCDQTMIASDWLSWWREHSTPITDSITAKTRQWLISLHIQRLLQPTHIGAIIETWSNRQCISFVSPQSPIVEKKLPPASKPMRGDLVWVPFLFAYVYSEQWLARSVVYLCTDWPMWWLLDWICDTRPIEGVWGVCWQRRFWKV